MKVPILLTAEEVRVLVGNEMNRRGYVVATPPKFICNIEQQGTQRDPVDIAVCTGVTVDILVEPVKPAKDGAA